MTRRRPSLAAVRKNFEEYEAPFHVKMAMLMSNNWKKLMTRSDCCGNDGEPGC